MKRYGNLYEKICSMDNLYLAFQHAKKGKGWYKEVQQIEKRPYYYLAGLQWMLQNHLYKTSEYATFTKKDGKKEREIYKLPFFPDRIAQWAVLQVIEPQLLAYFTDDTYSANRISQPLLDRMDLCVKVEKVHYQELEQTTQEESSESIRERVVMAHKRQRERYEKEGFFYNSQIPAKKIATFCALKKDEKRHMQQIYETLNLSVRSYHKILKTARTIADIEGSEEIRMEHLHEAICYRSIDSNFWERRR